MSMGFGKFIMREGQVSFLTKIFDRKKTKKDFKFENVGKLNTKLKTKQILNGIFQAVQISH